MVATRRRSCSNPKSWFSRLCKAAVSSPADDSKTSDSAACSATSVFLESEPVRAVDRWRREALRSDLLVWPSMPEAMPKATPVASEATKANSSTGMEGDAPMGTPAKPADEGNAKCRIRRVPANAIPRPQRRQTTKQDAFDERLHHKPRRSRPERHAQRCLPPPLHAANEHETGHVGADDQQHKSVTAIQDPKPALVLFAMLAIRRLQGSGTRLLRKFRAIPGAHLAQCESSHCFSSTRISASIDAAAAPGWMRPIQFNQWYRTC